MTLPYRLIVILCFSAPHGCVWTRPIFFATVAECGRAGAMMMEHAREVASGDVRFSCSSLGGTGR